MLFRLYRKKGQSTLRLSGRAPQSIRQIIVAGKRKEFPNLGSTDRLNSIVVPTRVRAEIRNSTGKLKIKREGVLEKPPSWCQVTELYYYKEKKGVAGNSEDIAT